MRAAILLLPVLVASVPALAAETIAVAPFHGVELRGGGAVVVRPGPVQRVTILSGSSRFTSFHVNRTGELRIDACNARCPQHYDLRIEIVSPRAPDVAIEGGGGITATAGFAPQSQLSAAIQGGGRIDFRSVNASSVNAAIDGGGKILTGHSSSLTAALNGGGEVLYLSSGNVTEAIRGGGVVRQGD
jgi:hypothetical protein